MGRLNTNITDNCYMMGRLNTNITDRLLNDG
jgi:hypothetical protein